MSIIIDILRRRAENQGERQAYIFLEQGERESLMLTYAELDKRARAIAATLQKLARSGERALLLYPAGLDFVLAFFGCLYSGVVAVPVFSLSTLWLNRRLPRLLAITNDSQPVVVLTTSEMLTMAECFSDDIPEFKKLRWVATDKITNELAVEWRETDIREDQLAFLQYTSGSTSAPKGVMVSYENLMNNLVMINQVLGDTDESVYVSWLPLFHDMGLIGVVLQNLYLGAKSIIMSPSAFLRKPVRWLQAISRYQATTSGGPNFAYDLCVRKISAEDRATLDLSSWKLAFNGAEPVRAETLEQFARTFEPCGFRREAFYPCYGLAEATLMVTGGRKATFPVTQHVKKSPLKINRVVEAFEAGLEVQTLVSCGQPILEEKIAIVHPEKLIRCSPGQVGEIWVSSLSVAQGYWNKPEETRQTFQASLADTGEGPFLRTGDLGYLHGGELFVTGRLKDLIILHGQNYYPQDIEWTIEECHTSIRPGCTAAFPIEVNGEDRLVVVAEVDASGEIINAEEIITSIQQAVMGNHQSAIYSICLLKSGSIPKTSSGKIQRHACRIGFLDETLEILHRWDAPQLGLLSVTGEFQLPKGVDAEAIQSFLRQWLSKVLHVSPAEIDPELSFAQYGLSSVVVVELANKLSEWLGYDLDYTLAWNYPTISALSQYLAGVKQGTSLVKTSSRQQTHQEPIAIIGMACRFPGEANSPEALWELLREGRDAIVEIPAERWDMDYWYDPDPNTEGKIYTRFAGLLRDIDKFDAPFFGISPREALSMDPQQRLLLEVSIEALERAGIPPYSLMGTSTGVFVGIWSSDYSYRIFGVGFPDAIDAYSGTGNTNAVAAGRIAYSLGLRGPTVALDTASSSSLVAVHMACQSLRAGDSDLALAGGVNLLLDPEPSVCISRLRALAPDGRCKTFDARANGYVRSEGCGVVALKRLSDAKRDGDPILAVIRGTAINQDGKSNGLTAPSGSAQEELIRRALEQAGVGAAKIGYVECHGTGSVLGDPIEVQALGAVLGKNRSLEQPVVLGSVKTNIGHAEAAAGVAGLIKAVLCLNHKQIPQNLHFSTPNPHIPWAALPVKIASSLMEWPSDGKPRLAGVSSFGISGTNAHVILEEAPVPDYSFAQPLPPIGKLLLLSGQTVKALKAQASRYADYIETHPELALADICHSAALHRTHFSRRISVYLEEETVVEQLRNYATN
ncbi:MAG: beta-ketoacyl synthase N-terminal-like domain-containing protein, partial [Acidobacteriota bacterium]